MKITLLSDTHGMHHRLTDHLGSGDLIVHAGDLTDYGTADELEDFIDWFSGLDFKAKVFIAGNHDLILEEKGASLDVWRGKTLPNHTHYLQHEGITLEGFNIWGSPYSPYCMGMAFNKRRGRELQMAWEAIPLDTDILITHTPPLGVLDDGLGCEALGKRLRLVCPKLHVFGHIHRAYGTVEVNQTTFVNASIAGKQEMMDIRPVLAKPPIRFNL